MHRCLEKIIGKKNIYSDPGDCWSYGYDNSKFHELPEAVLFPKDKNKSLELLDTQKKLFDPIIEEREKVK